MAEHSTVTTSSTRRTLRALLAESTSGSDRADDSTAQLVDTAIVALGRVETAAEFLECQGTDRLARAVVTAVREGDEGTVRRGRAALETYQSFQAALDGEPLEDESGPVTLDSDSLLRR